MDDNSEQLFWKNIDLDEFGVLTLEEFSALELEPHYDPPYVASGYVSGVCNHEVIIISN